MAYVGRADSHALAVVELYGGEDPARFVPGSLGADPHAGIASSNPDYLVFGFDAEERARFAGWSPRAPSQPARLLSNAVPSPFDLAGLQTCLRRDGTRTA